MDNCYCNIFSVLVCNLVYAKFVTFREKLEWFVINTTLITTTNINVLQSNGKRCGKCERLFYSSAVS